jgi:hypothetical protein
MSTSLHTFSARTDRPDAGLDAFESSRGVRSTGLTARLARAKFAYTTRNVRLETLARLLEADPDGDVGPRPHAGDLVLARVEAIGQHKRIELANGRRATLFVGDEVVVAYGNRYAPDQFEAEVPANLGPCDLVAAGGVAAETLSLHSSMNLPTRLSPIALLGDQRGRRVNLSSWALGQVTTSVERPPVVAVVGTAMNAGKTTTAANLIRGLAASGRRVGAAKVTGTGAGGDLWLMSDAGAHPVLDFTHAGLPSTYRASLHDVETLVETLVDHLVAAGVEAIVLEVADGVCQAETAALLGSVTFRETVDAVVFAASDALGAAHGAETVERHGLPLLAVSGALTASPLAIREARRLLSVPVLDLEGLQDPDCLTAILDEAPVVLAA